MSDCDFLIIGGGIAGLSAGAKLAEIGSVILIEGESALGYHASGRSAALFEPHYGSPSTVALNQASADHHMAAGVLSDRGLLLVGTAQTDDAFEHDKATMHMAEIGLADAADIYPILDTNVVVRAAIETGAKDIDTDKLLQGFANTLKRAGGAIKTGQAVSAVRRHAHGWVGTVAGEEISAKYLVNAAGAWADEVAEMAGITKLGLRPLRRSMARVPAPESHDVSQWPMVFGPGENWYSKPDAGALLVSPAEEDQTTPHDAFADDLTLAQGLARFEAHVHYETPRLLASWAGLRTFAPDRALVVGADPHDPQFLWCAGQGGYGMQSAPAVGQLTADLVAGRTPQVGADIVAALSPARFGERRR